MLFSGADIPDSLQRVQKRVLPRKPIGAANKTSLHYSVEDNNGEDNGRRPRFSKAGSIGRLTGVCTKVLRAVRGRKY